MYLSLDPSLVTVQVNMITYMYQLCTGRTIVLSAHSSPSHVPI